jgi:hypothetical protein
MEQNRSVTWTSNLLFRFRLKGGQVLTAVDSGAAVLKGYDGKARSLVSGSVLTATDKPLYLRGGSATADDVIEAETL